MNSEETILELDIFTEEQQLFFKEITDVFVKYQKAFTCDCNTDCKKFKFKLKKDCGHANTIELILPNHEELCN